MLNRVRSPESSVSLDELFSRLPLAGTRFPSDLPPKVLFWGERASGISSYLAGWMAGGEIDVIVLDGANGFDPYLVSSFARKALISPERLLKKIRIARAFTCYQMATLVERLALLLRSSSPFRRLPEGRREGGGAVGVILLGPITTFLDEDVPEREVGPLFERTLRKMEGMAEEGFPFLLFQSYGFSQNHSGKETSKNSPFSKGGAGGFLGSRRDHFMRRLFQFSNLTWKVLLEGEGPKLVLEKGPFPLPFERSEESVIGYRRLLRR